MAPKRSAQKKSRRIIIKIGTRVLTQTNGSLAKKRLQLIVQSLIPFYKKGDEFLIVTSGAVGLGRKTLKLKPPLDIQQKQVCASVGQVELMNVYKELFKKYRITPAQILVTAGDFADRAKYLNLRDTIESLLEMGVVPVINENDPISTEELSEEKGRSFGDNDKLSAIVATKINAQMLVILTDVDGIYSENPKLNPKAQVLKNITHLSELIIKMEGKSAVGRGGMQTKIEAVRIASEGGVMSIIASGLKPQNLKKIWQDPRSEDRPGTLIEFSQNLQGRKKWIGLSSGYEGVVVVNDGAKQAITEKQASLLPAGVVDVRGQFQRGQIVSIRDQGGNEIGRGIANYSSADTRKIIGLKTNQVRDILGADSPDVLIQRDNLVLLNRGAKIFNEAE
ncbi:MAG: glutamate 5-kinase [Bdellovibrionales bacterium]